MSIARSIALITGANEGVGFEVAKKLSQDANYHVILSSRNFGKKQEAAASLAKEETHGVVEIDVTTNDSIAAAVEKVKTKHGRLDALVNNAGISPYQMAPGTPLREEFAQIHSANVTSAMSVTEAFLPLLRNSKTPRIVFVSSAVGPIAEKLDPKSGHYGLPMQAMAYKCKLTLSVHNVGQCALTAHSSSVQGSPEHGHGPL